MIRERGPISFAEFMETVLYDPDGGYYTSGEKRVGFEGADFFTSPAMSPAFGMTLARLMPLADEAVGHPETFHIVELGAGSGTTAKQILDTLRDDDYGFYERVKYICVERGGGDPGGRPIEWVRDLTGVGPVNGVVLSNEFFDALPVRRIAMREDGLKEIMVGLDAAGSFCDVESPLSDPVIDKYLEENEVELAIDQEAEVCIEAERWITDIAKSMDNGVVVAIDYGHPAAELYASHRKRGTVMAYYRHKTVDNPYENIGRQDITAHVNFSAMARWGDAVGLETVAFTDQLRFLLDLGIHEVFAKIEAGSDSFNRYQVTVQSAKTLIMPGGMGETFKVLVQQKGLDGSAADIMRKKIRSKYAL